MVDEGDVLYPCDHDDEMGIRLLVIDDMIWRDDWI
jgi:hypothetical protein